MPSCRPAAITESFGWKSNSSRYIVPGVTGSVTPTVEAGFSGSIQPRVMTVPLPVAG